MKFDKFRCFVKISNKMKKYLAEMVGTMVMVLMGCGSAVFAGNAAGAVSAGVGTIGVALAFGLSVVAMAYTLAFGLSVVAMAYTIGNISGCHINPAITLGVWLSGRMSGKDAIMYMVFQVIGAIIGSAVLFGLVSAGTHNGPTATGSNSFADGCMLQAFVAELVFTFIFVLVVLGSTDSKKGAGNFAGLAIGLTLVLIKEAGPCPSCGCSLSRHLPVELQQPSHGSVSDPKGTETMDKRMAGHGYFPRRSFF